MRQKGEGLEGMEEFQEDPLEEHITIDEGNASFVNPQGTILASSKAFQPNATYNSKYSSAHKQQEEDEEIVIIAEGSEQMLKVSSKEGRLNRSELISSSSGAGAGGGAFRTS